MKMVSTVRLTVKDCVDIIEQDSVLTLALQLC
jgi:hypothetical protein